MKMLRPAMILLAANRLPSAAAFRPAAVMGLSRLSTAVRSTAAPEANRQIPIHEEKNGDVEKEKPKVEMEKTEDQGEDDGRLTMTKRGFLSPWRAFDDVLRNDPFFLDPFFRDDDFFPSLMPVLKSRSFPDMPSSKLLRSSPGYEIKEDEKMYQIAIEVPEGVEGAKDITVNLEKDETTGNSVLHVKGERKIETDNGFRETRFDQRFSIGRDVMDVEQLSANLHDGILVIKAPKLPVLPPPNVKKIDVTEQPHWAAGQNPTWFKRIKERCMWPSIDISKLYN